jgi:hypothetical protein
MGVGAGQAAGIWIRLMNRIMHGCVSGFIETFLKGLVSSEVIFLCSVIASNSRRKIFALNDGFSQINLKKYFYDARFSGCFQSLIFLCYFLCKVFNMVFSLFIHLI